MPLKPLPKMVTRVVAALVFCSLLLAGSANLFAQQIPPAEQSQAQMLTPDQLDDLVAPVALYPDELLSQTLVASTYPLEVVEAFQWIGKNPGLAGQALTQAAEQQDWDPSVQALVVFPDVLHRLNDDVTWTTALGNAFLAQQQDVMDAVQRMRERAQQAGKLVSTPQENVVMAEQDGAPIIQIEPVNPDVIYVPVYDPVWIWGPAAWYPYPHWWWPSRNTLTGGFYFGFGPAINVGWFFGGGWNGWAGWGWHPGWGNHTVIVNNTFIRTNNFNTSHNKNAHGTSVWTHDPAHRANVPYPKQPMNDRNQGQMRPVPAPRPTFQPPAERPVHQDIPHSAPQPRVVPREPENSRPAPVHVDRAPSNFVPQRPAPVFRPVPAPRPEPAPRPAPAPRAVPSIGGRHK